MLRKNGRDKYENWEYVKRKTYEEEKYENQRRYKRMKQDRIDADRRNAQQDEISKVLIDAKDTVKKYDPNLETEEATKIVDLYKSLKSFVNYDSASVVAENYIKNIKAAIEQLKKNAGDAE